MEDALVGLTLIVVCGGAAQLLASYLRLPSILMLLAVGFAIGPEGAGLLESDRLFGELLFPVVSLSVAILLFEGGLSLRFRELGEHGGVVFRLVTVGAAVTWVVGATAAHLFLGLDPRLAVLLGAILTVTGPTVVLPILRQIRPIGAAGPILKWEGILIDPVGAVLAVLVFEGISQASVGAAALGGLAGIGRTVLVGAGIGIPTAWLLTRFLARYWIPDHLHSPMALAAALGAFTLSNTLQHESGLLTVTVLGVAMANQRLVSVRHILEFKENVRVLVIAGLFILLAARLRLRDFGMLDTGALFFLLALILVARPLAVALSALRSATTARERVLVAGMAPRGIVAAAVASIFALRLEAQGVAGAEVLIPATFLVIIATVTVYGLGAAPLANRLGLAVARPQGVLMLGAHTWARALAERLREHGIPVLLVDSNAGNAAAARMAGLPAYHGSLLAEDVDDRLDLAGIGRLFALTPNDEVNALSAIHYAHLFGRREVYQLPPRAEQLRRDAKLQAHLRGRYLFAEGLDHDAIDARLAAGARIRATPLTEQFEFGSWRERYGPDAIPLLTIDAQGLMLVATVEKPLEPAPGASLVALVPPTRAS